MPYFPKKAQGNDLAQSLHARPLPLDGSSESTPPSSTARGEEASVEREAEKIAHPTEEDTGWGRHEGQDRPFLFLLSVPTMNTPGRMQAWSMFPLTSSVALPQFPHLQLEGNGTFATESSFRF